MIFTKKAFNYCITWQCDIIFVLRYLELISYEKFNIQKVPEQTETIS